MSLYLFMHDAHLRTGARVDHDTGNRALSGVLKHYQKQERLEAEIKLESQIYSAERKISDFRFSSNRGPQVKVRVEGSKISGDRLKRAIPIFEEGTVDEDLLNEGNRRLRDYFQRLGYFDVKVDHKQKNAQTDAVLIIYIVALGSRRRRSAKTLRMQVLRDSRWLAAQRNRSPSFITSKKANSNAWACFA